MCKESHVFVFKLRDASKDFRRAWRDASLTWEGERAGLIRIACCGSLEQEEARFSERLGFEVRALELVTRESVEWDLYDFVRQVSN